MGRNDVVTTLLGAADPDRQASPTRRLPSGGPSSGRSIVGGAVIGAPARENAAVYPASSTYIVPRRSPILAMVRNDVRRAAIACMVRGTIEE